MPSTVLTDTTIEEVKYDVQPPVVQPVVAPQRQPQIHNAPLPVLIVENVEALAEPQLSYVSTSTYTFYNEEEEEPGGLNG